MITWSRNCIDPVNWVTGREIHACIHNPGTKAKAPPRDGGKRFCICISCIWSANGTAFKGDTENKRMDYLRYPIAIKSVQDALGC